jgi:hypothetical protein
MWTNSQHRKSGWNHLYHNNQQVILYFFLLCTSRGYVIETRVRLPGAFEYDRNAFRFKLHPFPVSMTNTTGIDNKTVDTHSKQIQLEEKHNSLNREGDWQRKVDEQKWSQQNVDKRMVKGSINHLNKNFVMLRQFLAVQENVKNIIEVFQRLLVYLEKAETCST